MVDTLPLTPHPTEFGWKIYVIDDLGYRQGEIDQYVSASLKPVYNDVGTWSLTVDRRSDQAAALVTPGWGIEVRRHGSFILSGPATIAAHTRDGTTSPPTDQLTVSGATGEVWLERRDISPSPTESAPPYTVQQYDARSGLASTVIAQYVDAQLGPGAIPSRRYAPFVVSDPVIGGSVSYTARFDNLLTVCQTLAQTGAIGFRVVGDGAGHLVFQSYLNTDRTGSIKFSTGLGNLAAFRYSISAPKANYEYVLGQATYAGTTNSVISSQTIVEVPDSAAIATWGRIEGNTNSASSSATSDLVTAGQAQLVQSSQQSTMTATPIEIIGYQYGVDYNLGDKITFQLEDWVWTPYGNALVQDIIRTVDIELNAQSQSSTPYTVTLGVGTPAASQISKVFAALKQQEKRLRYLELH